MKPTIKYDSKEKKNSSLCIFASFHKGLYMDDFIHYFVDQLYGSNFDVVFVSNSVIADSDLAKLKKKCKRIIEKENLGLDFSAYKTGLLSEKYGTDYDHVLLTNVSIYGPLFPLEIILKKMEPFDFWGLTENYEISYHLQSYFLCFNSKVTKSDVWRGFWDNVVSLEDKEEIILSYEVGLTRLLMESSLFNYSSYIRYFDFAKHIKSLEGYYNDEGSQEMRTYNSTLYHWDILIEKYNFPFLKKTLVDRKEHWREAGIITSHWKKIIMENTRYPVQLIKE
ncbi:MAG: rhamnan synthesis F family protein [Bacteroidia bacterium]